ncbi:SseB family protein [Cellulomonas sp. ACRRI]|uniref:SseB family protein n=1 Tax=Cellulomonas sp. ACRRI TaxID=2918188 RepID=UPI001EF18738|nr:SseB family protein [Cellulomonas sp. ACRRI]MCG7286414.1 SseB family protein [Cellulomonas sp. ACRRI]
MTGPELEALIRRGMQGEAVDVIGALLVAELVVPSGGAVGPNFEGFVPVLFDRGETPMLAVFTSLELTTRVSHQARFALTMTGRDLVLRMPRGHGLVVNPGHEVGFELFPDAVQAVARRAEEDSPGR